MQDAVSQADTVNLHGEVQRAELEVSVLALEVAWLAAQTAEALAAHNELWREEQWARRVAFQEAANNAKDLGWEVEVGFLRSWADAACELRHSDSVDWHYICCNHRQDLAERALNEARARLRQLRKELYRSLQATGS